MRSNCSLTVAKEYVLSSFSAGLLFDWRWEMNQTIHLDARYWDIMARAERDAQTRNLGLQSRRDTDSSNDVTLTSCHESVHNSTSYLLKYTCEQTMPNTHIIMTGHNRYNPLTDSGRHFTRLTCEPKKTTKFHERRLYYELIKVRKLCSSPVWLHDQRTGKVYSRILFFKCRPTLSLEVFLVMTDVSTKHGWA